VWLHDAFLRGIYSTAVSKSRALARQQAAAMAQQQQQQQQQQGGGGGGGGGNGGGGGGEAARLSSHGEQISDVRSIHWSPYDRVGVVNADP
jgi:hypothetical protein